MESLPLREQPPLPPDFRANNIKLLAEQLAQLDYPGYPRFEDRLWTEREEWFSPIRLPLGPWETSGGIVPTIQERVELAEIVHEMDIYGRPLHPWFHEMVTDPAVGVVTGKGFFWNWGPNYTADPIAVRYDQSEPHILLITRSDTGQWALPGGFIDSTEDAIDAAKREADEEALIDLTDPSILATQIYCGPLSDIRTTANAWPETTAIRFDLPDSIAKTLTLEPYSGGDDAVVACWQPLSQIDNLLFNSHRLLVTQAIATAP